ncbi:MAG: hypothetical protein O7G87_19575, partial [bacterium]|nr:hypothetical protein [bacterium]
MPKIPIFQIGRAPRTYWIYGVLMVLLTLAGFGNLYTHQFWDGWDDQSMLMDTAAIAKDISFLFSPDRLLPIRPSKDLIFLMGYLLWGENLAAFH